MKDFIKNVIKICINDIGMIAFGFVIAILGMLVIGTLCAHFGIAFVLPF